MVDSAAILALQAQGISFTLFTHSQLPPSLEKAADERGQRPEQVIRSILFRYGEGKFVMVLIAGPGQISWKKVRRHLGARRVSMAKETEVLAVTGYEVGTVNPLGLEGQIRVLVDGNVLKFPEISIGSGVRGSALILNPLDLLLAVKNFTIGDFSGG